MKDIAADAAPAETDQQFFGQKSVADRLASEGEQHKAAQEVGDFEEAFASAANHIFQEHQPVSSQTRARKGPPLEETADVLEEDFEEEDANEQRVQPVRHQLVHEKTKNGDIAVDSPLQVLNGPAAYDEGDDLVDEPLDEARAAHSRGKCI